MTRTHGGAAAFSLALVAGVVGLRPAAADGPVAVAPPPRTPAPAGSAIAALLDANGGRPPATGEELVRVLGKLGKFAQLPVVFSAVRRDAGLGNPRVVLTPPVTGLSPAGVTEPNLTGRLFLAANLDKGVNGADPRVTSVEFISWNTLRRRFDFGVIENLGGGGEPELRLVDGGRCFSCHKNKGPILGAAPWSNTTHHGGLRFLVSGALKVSEVMPPRAGPGVRDRIDGMALAVPEAAVDAGVRLGMVLRLNRETFRLVNRSAAGRKAFVAMLVAVTEPGDDGTLKAAAATATAGWGNDDSYTRFRTDWAALTKATPSGILSDRNMIPPSANVWWAKLQVIEPLPQPPSNFANPAEEQAYATKLAAVVAKNEAAVANLRPQLAQAVGLDTARGLGRVGIPSAAQPSNPRAFVQPPPVPSPRPAAMVNPLMLAGAIGLTEGDRRFLADALAAAARRAGSPKVTAGTLARAVFEGPEFADVVAGGPLPDRDEFKDRFVAGLDAVLKTEHGLADGFAPDRREYASGPRYDPGVAEEAEAAVVPTSACLRCHDVRGGGQSRMFEPIPALAFDPLDPVGRAGWARAAADKKRKQEVLANLLKRMHTDADMPPEDAPEHDLFRVKGAAAFAEAKAFLEAELEKAKKP